MSSEEERWAPASQGSRLWTQLEDGISGLMLDTHEDRGETLLCHSF